MKIEELEPEFIRLVCKDAWMAISDTILSDKVSGVRFKCPNCFRRKGTLEGVHYVMCWRPHISPKAFARVGRWEFSGKFIHGLTLSSPVHCKSCDGVFYLENGEITLLEEKGG